LDNIIIGRDKVFVNLSRFNRSEGNEREGDRREARVRSVFENRDRSNSRTEQKNIKNPRKEAFGSYAQVVRSDGHMIQGRDKQNSVLSYVAEKDDVQRLKKCFIGEVIHPGSSYNIQNAFHSQGYFGVKVTRLGSNLTLLEGQEEGEVQALMDDAKEWMDKWFKEIRSWSPKEIDRDRNVWLRIHGIPAHAYIWDILYQFY
jgi:hypothetical protein